MAHVHVNEAQYLSSVCEYSHYLRRQKQHKILNIVIYRVLSTSPADQTLGNRPSE